MHNLKFLVAILKEKKKKEREKQVMLILIMCFI